MNFRSWLSLKNFMEYTFSEKTNKQQNPLFFSDLIMQFLQNTFFYLATAVFSSCSSTFRIVLLAIIRVWFTFFLFSPNRDCAFFKDTLKSFFNWIFSEFRDWVVISFSLSVSIAWSPPFLAFCLPCMLFLWIGRLAKRDFSSHNALHLRQSLRLWFFFSVALKSVHASFENTWNNQ